jgi:hypothetical protein
MDLLLRGRSLSAIQPALASRDQRQRYAVVLATAPKAKMMPTVWRLAAAA